MPGRHPHDEERRHRIAGNDLVAELEKAEGVCHHCHEIHHLGAAVSQHIADRVLHPAVGQKYPESGKVRRNGHQPDGYGVRPFRHLVPAEDPDADKNGLEEKGHGRLNGQRRAEDITHVLGIFRPVHAELEFEGDAGHDAEGEVDEKQLPPELGHLQVELIAASQIAGFHVRHHHGKPEGQRHKNEVEHACDRKLQPAQG